MSDAAFAAEVEGVIQLYERTIGHAATRTRQMIEQYGVIEALSRLMISADLQKGFKALRDSNQLDHTFEALVVKNRKLFSSKIVDAADWRLKHPHDLM